MTEILLIKHLLETSSATTGAGEKQRPAGHDVEFRSAAGSSSNPTFAARLAIRQPSRTLFTRREKRLTRIDAALPFPLMECNYVQRNGIFRPESSEHKIGRMLVLPDPKIHSPPFAGYGGKPSPAQPGTGNGTARNSRVGKFLRDGGDFLRNQRFRLD
jgi:hypothetical protein